MSLTVTDRESLIGSYGMYLLLVPTGAMVIFSNNSMDIVAGLVLIGYYVAYLPNIFEAAQLKNRNPLVYVLLGIPFTPFIYTYVLLCEKYGQLPFNHVDIPKAKYKPQTNKSTDTHTSTLDYEFSKLWDDSDFVDDANLDKAEAAKVYAQRVHEENLALRRKQLEQDRKWVDELLATMPDYKDNSDGKDN